MRRAMTVLEIGSPQEGTFYDHPYFGQIFLSGFLNVAGFPQTAEQSLECYTWYLVYLWVFLQFLTRFYL